MRIEITVNEQNLVMIDIEKIRAQMRHEMGESTKEILWRKLGDGFSIREVLGEVQAHYIRRAMKEGGQSQAVAARLLGLKEGCFSWQYKKMKGKGKK